MDIGIAKIDKKMDFLASRDCSKYDVLDHKIKVLHETAWRDKWAWDSDQYTKWLGNFQEDEERLNAMFLLSKFMYFDNDTIRELMVRIYQDLYKRPIVYEIRRNHSDTMDGTLIEKLFAEVQKKTRFLSIGNPSESSAHLLYFFRQENGLKRDLFITPHELFEHGTEGEIIKTSLNIEGIDRIVVLDDFCGSGNQATKFNASVVKILKEKAPHIYVSYFALFASEEGLNNILELSYDQTDAMFILDETYKCFSENSRFFVEEDAPLKAPCKEMSEKYGKKLSKHPLGYQDCQMLLGFHHNTPNNTLPIFWQEKNWWAPIFKRYAKIY